LKSSSTRRETLPCRFLDAGHVVDLHHAHDLLPRRDDGAEGDHALGLLDVYGIGVLLLGDSGIGKSECALDLITAATA